MRILIDVLGSDKGIGEIVKGALLARDNIEYRPIFVGPKNEILKYLPNNYNNKIEIIDALDLITNDDKPTTAIRRKKESSMVKAFRALDTDKAEALLSTGSTGALLAGATLITGRIKNVQRAAITLVLPGIKSNTIILDVGANMDITPELMIQFAKMGSSYAKAIFNKNKPKIGILNIGTEESKGNKLSQETYTLLKQSKLNFIGNIEPFNLLDNEADVIVTDGFAGNVALKSIEGSLQTFMGLIKGAMTSSFKTKIAGGLLGPSLRQVVNKFKLDDIGAAPLLGTKKPVFKAHGSSNYKHIQAGIYQIVNFVNSGVISDIEKLMGD